MAGRQGRKVGGVWHPVWEATLDGAQDKEQMGGRC